VALRSAAAALELLVSTSPWLVGMLAVSRLIAAARSRPVERGMQFDDVPAVQARRRLVGRTVGRASRAGAYLRDAQLVVLDETTAALYGAFPAAGRELPVVGTADQTRRLRP
jgi:hypothetical protein